MIEHEALCRNLEKLYMRTKQMNKASLIIIDGGVGEGKTTLAVQCADYINKLDGKQPIDLLTGIQIGMGGDEFLQKLRECYAQKLPILIYDEAGDFSRRSAMTRFNATINRTFETFRAFQIIVICCLPTMQALDNGLFQKSIPRLLLHCYNRKRNYGNIKVYSLYRTYYTRAKMEKLIIPSKAYGIVNPNFHARFKDLEPERQAQLTRLSTRGKLDILRKSEIESKGLISAKDLATRCGRTRQWVNLHLRRLNIRPQMEHGRKAYFPMDSLGILSSLVKQR